MMFARLSVSVSRCGCIHFSWSPAIQAYTKYSRTCCVRNCFSLEQAIIPHGTPRCDLLSFRKILSHLSFLILRERLHLSASGLRSHSQLRFLLHNSILEFAILKIKLAQTASV